MRIPPAPRRQSVPVAARTPAARLREISALDAGRLAMIFGVSRATYQHWISGSTPRGPRRDHLLRVLSLVEEVAEHFGSGDRSATWLLAPVSPEGRTPVEFLRHRQYATFRGFLLRVPIEHRLMRRPAGPRRSRQLSPAEFEDALERTSPRAWREDFLNTTDTQG